MAVIARGQVTIHLAEKGEDGDSVFITYHDNPATLKPVRPTDNGTSGGWHITPSDKCVWISQKVAPNVSSGIWGEPMQFKGDPGNDIPGRMLYRDPEFRTGMNGIAAYNWSGTVAITRIANTIDSPTSSSHCLQIKTTTAASPGLGGFGHTFFSRPKAVFIQKFVAKIPAGYSVRYTSNAMGNGRVDEWLTPTVGTGKYETYLHRTTCGVTGEFSTGGYIYIDSATGYPFTWYLAYATVYDTSDNAILDAGKDKLFQGVFLPNRIYYNNADRQDLVKYGEAWYKYIGPDKTSYSTFNVNLTPPVWESFGSNYESMATSYLWAEGATLADFKFQNGAIASQEKIGNKPKIYLNGKTGKAGFLDVEVEGTLRNPFVAFDGIRNVFEGDALNVKRDNVVMPNMTFSLSPDGFSWGPENSGRIIRLVDYKWSTGVSSGYIWVWAPPDSNKYFYENGESYSKINVSREAVELLGYGTDTTFYGWIVISRVNLMSVYRSGVNKKILFQGVFNPNYSSGIEAAWSSELESQGRDSFQKPTVNRLGTGYYRVQLPFHIFPTDFHVALTGCSCGQNGSSSSKIIHACLVAKGVSGSRGYFDVKTTIDGTPGDGGFYFEMIGAGNWIRL